jgi:hypothetical protein
VRDWDGDRDRPHRAADPDSQRGTKPPANRVGAGDPDGDLARGGLRRHLLCPRRCHRRHATTRWLRVRPRGDCGQCPGGITADLDARPGARRAPHGSPALPREAPLGRGDARRHHGDLHRQDRDPHGRPDDDAIHVGLGSARGSERGGWSWRHSRGHRPPAGGGRARLPGHGRARGSDGACPAGRRGAARDRSRQAPAGAPAPWHLIRSTRSESA